MYRSKTSRLNEEINPRVKNEETYETLEKNLILIKKIFFWWKGSVMTE